ncbi:MAG: GIDE domain-containing protein [Nevskiales bacterium]
MTEFIRSTPESFFTGMVILTVLMMLAALYFFWRNLHQGRLMEDMPTSRIRSAAQGYVEIDGRAKMMKGDPILAPLSRQPCVWWQYKITETTQQSTSSGTRARRRVIDSGRSDALFLVNDGTGECIVDPDGARILHSHRHRWSGSQRWPQSGYRHSVLSLFARYHYEEWLIKANDPLYSIGYFRTQSAVQGHFDQQAELNELLREWKQDQALLQQRFDVNKDGRIDATEWEAARRVALKQLRREQFAEQMPQGLHVLSRPKDKRPYIISGISQDKLIFRSRLMSIATLVLFLGCIGFMVWAFDVRGA